MRILLCALGALVLVGCGDDGHQGAKQTHDLSGSITTHSGLKGAAYLSAQQGDACYADDGYDDIAEGTQAVVKDGDGKLLAVGKLNSGTVTEYGRCTFTFEVVDIPESSFYVLSVSHRGDETYSATDLAAADWHVNLTLG